MTELPDQSYELEEAFDLGHRLADAIDLNGLKGNIDYPYSAPRRGTNQVMVNNAFEGGLSVRILQNGLFGVVTLPEPPDLVD